MHTRRLGSLLLGSLASRVGDYWNRLLLHMSTPAKKYRCWEIDWDSGAIPAGRMLSWDDIKLWSMMFFGKTSQYIFMMWTGEVDADGVEIYDGDILGKMWYGKLRAFGTVEWTHTGESIYDDEQGGFIAAPVGFEFPEMWKEQNLRVIGNIYQNPELNV